MTKSKSGPEDGGSGPAIAGGPNADNANSTGATAESAGSPEAHHGGVAGHSGMSPTTQPQYLQGYPAHLTPQQPGQGYYGYQQPQGTPEPPSPAGGQIVYDVGNLGTFFQQPGAHYNSPFVPGTPSSPRRTAAMGGIPPASPLFPRVPTGQGQGIDQRLMGAPPSPSVPYLSPALGPNSMYQGYPANGIGGHPDSPDDIAAWGDRNQQNMFPPGSPQVPYVPGMTRANAGRAYSFDDPTGMLPPVADQQDQQGNLGYPYGNAQANAGGAGGTLFANQQPFGYAGGPGEMYGTPGSPLQPRPAAQMPGYPPGHPMAGGMRQQQMGLYGQYYPATSPGPPIQTTESNKGPDGANLFIFHIPNHFTNLDMYQLFCPYGNLLSVRIMVEKDSGRSRGFGFVSYDAPASAALAIKDLNGFAIGNKRLKVQHKQIQSRPSDNQRDNEQGFYVGVGGVEGNFQHGGYGSHLPPSGAGAMAAHNMGPSSPWLDAPQGGGVVGDDGIQPSLNPGMNATNGPGLDGATDPSAGVGGIGNPEGALSPLANLDPLLNALPDVPGTE